MRNVQLWIICLIFIVAGPFLSAQNAQDIVPLSHPVYRAIDELRILAGMVPASGSRPYSRERALELLEELERAMPDAAWDARFAALQESLGSGLRVEFGQAVSLSVSPKTALELYGHVDLLNGSFGTDADYLWRYGYERRAPMLQVPILVGVSSWFAAQLDLDLREDYRMVDNRFSTTKDSLSCQYNITNWTYQPTDIDTFLPFRAYFAAGSGVLSLQFGRDMLDWGNGLNGNLMFSSTMDYLDSLRLKLDTRLFTYSFFYANTQPPADDLTNYYGLGGHRLELRLFGERASLALTEGVSFGGENMTANLMMELNPFIVFHSWIMPVRSNVMMTVEAGWTIVPGLHAYGQFAIDDVKSGPEIAAGDSKPNAFGYLAGLRGVLPDGRGGLWSIYAEATLTDPWFYYQDNMGSNIHFRYRRYVWSFVDPQSPEWIVKPTGYWTGPDALTATLACAWQDADSLRAEMTARYIAKGALDVFSTETEYTDAKALGPLTGVVEHTLSFGLNLQKKLPWNLALGLDTAIYIVSNANHVSDARALDLEAALSLWYRF